MTPAKPFGAVDISKIKPGDEVLLRFSVTAAYASCSWPHVQIDPSGQLDGGISEHNYLSAGAATIAGHTPKALAVGDRVRLLTGGCGFIRAIIGERAWVDLVDDPAEMLNGCAYGLAFMERADA